MESAANERGELWTKDQQRDQELPPSFLPEVQNAQSRRHRHGYHDLRVVKSFDESRPYLAFLEE
jgi:hypothetical protein